MNRSFSHDLGADAAGNELTVLILPDLPGEKEQISGPRGFGIGSNRQASDLWLNVMRSPEPLSMHDEFQFLMSMHAGFLGFQNSYLLSQEGTLVPEFRGLRARGARRIGLRVGQQILTTSLNGRGKRTRSTPRLV